MTATEWRGQGYRVAVLFDDERPPSDAFDMVVCGGAWRGFPIAVNRLCREVGGDVVVVAGDDVSPDKHKTGPEIAAEFLQRFPDTFGVMSPTGDRFGAIDIACVAPWVGRRFINDAYGGAGPYWSEYWHYYSDKEIQDVAILLGAFQQRPDLTQYHNHWQRAAGGGTRPPHLQEALRRWEADRDLQRKREDAGYPGHARRASA